MNEKMPNKRILKESALLQILNNISKNRSQINFDSEAARKTIAKTIVENYE